MKRNPSIWLGLAFVLGACGGEEAEVTLSGAVARPGKYAHRPEWAVADYVKAAGGYTEEAVVNEGRLIRVLRDPVTNEEVNRSWRPLASSPRVMEGDVIHVPFRTYAIAMDTVRAIEDLAIQWREREYRVPKGWMAEGRTRAGVMVVSVIGEGRVIGSENGDALGRFQYLYLHLHPGVYGQLAFLVESPSENRLVLEDAVGVHQSLFPRLRHRSGQRAEMPPEGHLRVLAGVWPNPRSKTAPGAGMRKRKYKDGREWTTFPDGRQRTVFPDGRVEVEFPDGSRKIHHADGGVEATDAVGNVRVTHPDGRISATFADGNREERLIDGRIVQRFKTGTRRTILPDGTEETQFADGAVHVKRRDGTVETTFPEGMTETRHVDGRIVAVTGDGHRVTVFPDGRRLTRAADGTVLEEFADGRRVQSGPDGERVEVFIDGTRRAVLKDGATVLEKPDGSRVERHADGTIMEIHPDGRKVQTDVDGIRLETRPDGRETQTDTAGNRLETFPDGRRTQTDAEGNRVEEFPDGTRIKTFANAYRYWGPLRDDLVAVDEAPQQLAPGGHLHVSGVVHSEPEDLMAAVFRLPDGNVFEIPAEREQGRFSFVFPESVFTTPGNYRLQVRALLAGESVVVADRALVVGDPPPLGKMILTVPPFRGADDARDRIEKMVHRVRGRLRLPELETHARLAEFAGMKIWDVMARGALTPEPAHEGALSFARGPSVEEAFTFMMLSGAHRQGMLSTEWARWGVAVQQDGDDVLVVLAFGAD